MIVKRLSDALTAGDPIRGIIRESLLNQDGKTETITSPSQAAQEALIRGCYRNAGLDPRDTQYFEAHGTGTPTGDPIEARAIAAIFRDGRPPNDPLLIGSVKTNIGHTETTSGLASTIKVILALERGMIPPSINYETPNPKLALADWRLKVPTNLEQWPKSGSQGKLRASINNFGFGGSNAHVIMERGEPWLWSQDVLDVKADDTFNGNEAAKKKATTEAIADKITALTNGIEGFEMPNYKSKVFILSARDEKTGQKMTARLKAHLEQNRAPNVEQYLESLAYTLGQRRTRFSWIAAQTISYTQGVDTIIDALDSPKFKFSKTTRQPRIGMVFTGQGAQWHAMGRELIVAYPIFKASLEEAEMYLQQFGADWSLMNELRRDADSTRVNETGLSIPICVAVQVSLVRLLKSWGIIPSAVTSHSSGEIAAAFAAGALNYRDAMAAAYYRAVLAADKRLRGPVKGGMVAIGVGSEQVDGYLEQLKSGGQVVIACVNSPQSTTVAGDLEAVIELETLAQNDGIFARRLRVDTGYHSHHMNPVAQPYLTALLKQSFEIKDKGAVSDTVKFSSPVTGGRITEIDEIAHPNHWIKSLLQPVQFLDAFTDMVLGDSDPSGSSVDVLIEVGPHTALGGPIYEILELPEFDGLKLPYFGCLTRHTNGRDSMQELAANLRREGCMLNMETVNFPWGIFSHVKVLIDLPPYPWNHETRHWHECRINRAIRERNQPPHDLLGQSVPGTNQDAPAWKNILRTSGSPWTRDHIVQGNIVYPGAGYVCLAIEAMEQMAEWEPKPHNADTEKSIWGYQLRDVEILQALVVPESTDGIEIQTSLRSTAEKEIGARGWKRFEVLSVTGDNRWTLHCTGLISIDTEPDDGVKRQNTLFDGDGGLTGYTKHIEPEDLYRNMRSLGVAHGPLFQTINHIVQSGTEPQTIIRFTVPKISTGQDISQRHVVHPTTLDVVIHAAYACLPGAGVEEQSSKVPRRIAKLRISKDISNDAGHNFLSLCTLIHADGQGLTTNMSVFDDEVPDTNPVLEIEGLAYQSLGRSAIRQQNRPWEHEVCGKIVWAPDMTLGGPQLLESVGHELASSVPIPAGEAQAIIDLRRVSVYFMLDTMAALTTQDISRLSSHHMKFYTWMRDQVQLAAAGCLGPDSSTWSLDSPAEKQRYITRAAESGVNGEMTCHLGPQLAAILRQEKAPLELMMERDKLLYRYYSGVLKSDRSLSHVAALLKKLVHKTPRARILEIGAGTGGATRYCLEALGNTEDGGPLAECYHFTDISSGFFEAAREEFAAWGDIMEFTKLDIEVDPAQQQGLVVGGYDIVIACEVLHATRLMANTMANVNKLLKPGGSLILLETTHDQIDMQLAFGLLPGWWLSEEPERELSPSLTTTLWHKVLVNAGFSGVDLEVRDCDDDDTYSLSTILSTVPAQQPLLPDTEDIVLVTSSQDHPESTWLHSLRKAIAGVTGYSESSLPAVEVLEDYVTTSSLGQDEQTASSYTGKFCIFIGEINRPILHDLDEIRLEGIKNLLTSCKGIMWVTRGGAVDGWDPKFALAAGFLRSLRNEYVGRRIVAVDLDPKSKTAWSDSAILTIVKVLGAIFANSEDDYVVDAPPDDFEFAERSGTILIPRTFRASALNRAMFQEPASDSDSSSQNAGNLSSEPLHQAERPLKLHVGIPGLLDTLTFGDDETAITRDGRGNSDTELSPELVEIEPHAYGVNFRDIMVAMGQLNDRIMGLECAGIITRAGRTATANGYAVGDRVFCLTCGPHIASRVRVVWTSAMHIPPSLRSFEEAASMPVIFLTAHMCLYGIANLRQGQTILIHAAAGGVGQAAIMLAKHIGAEIFATVSSNEKRTLIKSQYGIPEQNIFNSRDKSFVSGIRAATGGRGVDVVLNSLAGPLLQESFNLLSRFGHFVEIGRRDLEQNSLLEMQTFTRQASFTSFDLLQVCQYKGKEAHDALKELVKLTESGAVRPIHPVTAYPVADVSKAFRLLQSGKHLGKIVVSTGPKETVPVLPRSRSAVLSPHVSYLLVGGVGGIGRAIAHWMIAHGAKNLVLMSRTAATSKKSAVVVAELRKAQCTVKAVNCDVSNPRELVEALRSCESEGLPPIKGVIQAAMVLQVRPTNVQCLKAVELLHILITIIGLHSRADDYRRLPCCCFSQGQRDLEPPPIFLECFVT